MDSDPFAAWDDPAAPTKATTPTTKAPSSTDQDDTKDIARLSLEYQEEDPGWGLASASTSRANSPEKSRKKAPSAAAADVSPVSGIKPSIESGLPTLPPKKETEEEHTTQSAAPEESATAAIVEEEASAADDTKLEEAIPVDLVTKADNDNDEDDDDEDAFEDSRQEQQVEPVEDSIAPEDFAQKTTISSPPQQEPTVDDDGFDDFGEPAEAGKGGAVHDDFGDFDDFETGDARNDADFGDDGFGDDAFDEPADSAPATVPVQSIPAPVPTRTWEALDVTSRSNRLDLADSVQALLPLSSAAEKDLSNVPLRQVEGPSQVLVSEGSRQLWADLSSFSSVKPIDWVRSKTRWDYLISMGVPVNLDEIHSSFASGSGGSKQLPPLQLKYDSSANRGSGSYDSNGSGLQRSSSLKLSGTASGPSSAAQRSASTSNSPRNGNSSPALGSSTNRERIAERRREELGLGPAPQVDLRRAEELVNKTEDQLTLLSLPALKSLLRELNTLTTSTSSLLTHHLTLRESYQADSEMYNSMIKELVTGAASRFSGGGSGGSNSVAGA
ncbi:hypothetical protein NDA16_004541 [Ustilago loliicola]|nr:hypothetical protein NDA16_004541 [Ustilago loliicola]